MEPTSLEHAWREYVRRCGYDPDSTTEGMIYENSRQTWLAGYAAGAGYALSAVKKLAEQGATALATLRKAAGNAPIPPGVRCQCGEKELRAESESWTDNNGENRVHSAQRCYYLSGPRAG